MRLEPANVVCPKCGNGNYMRHLVGKNVGKLNMKCINCNSYFKSEELYEQARKKMANFGTWGEWLEEIGMLVKKVWPNGRVTYMLEFDNPIPADIAEKLGIEPKEDRDHENL